MVNYIGVEEANKRVCELYLKAGLHNHPNSFKYFLKHRSEETITVQDVTLKWKKIGRKICVDENELNEESHTTIKKLQAKKWEKEHGTLKQRADSTHGQFVSFTRGHHPGDQWEEYFCIKCEKKAKTKNEREECHICRDWNGCGRNCRLSHLICENCGITQIV